MISSRHALKEWNATCRALAEGRQIILLRKGGLLDEDGVFALEQSNFWMLPTAFHQEPHLLKTEHLDLLNESTFKPGAEKYFFLRHINLRDVILSGARNEHS